MKMNDMRKYFFCVVSLEGVCWIRFYSTGVIKILNGKVVKKILKFQLRKIFLILSLSLYFVKEKIYLQRNFSFVGYLIFFFFEKKLVNLRTQPSQSFQLFASGEAKGRFLHRIFSSIFFFSSNSNLILTRQVHQSFPSFLVHFYVICILNIYTFFLFNSLFISFHFIFLDFIFILYIFAVCSMKELETELYWRSIEFSMKKLIEKGDEMW